MNTRSSMAAASLVLAMTVFSAPANATLLFAENFENDLSAWTGKSNDIYSDGAHSGAIVSNPLGSGNVLNFTSITGWGDIFTRDVFSSPSGIFTLEYDYLGTCGQDDCGGFAGYSYELPGIHRWLAGTFTASGALDVNLDSGSWVHVVLEFTPINPGPIHLMFEDFKNSRDGAAGNAYFDNIVLRNMIAEVPEPAPMALLIFGLMGLGIMQWQRNRKQEPSI